MVKKSKYGVRFFVLNGIRFILVLAFVLALYQNRSLILVMSVAGFVLTFSPYILKRVFKTEIPGSFEIIVLLFIYGVLFIGEVRGLFAEFFWWDIFLNGIAAVALGFIGLTVMYVMYRGNVIKAGPYVMAVFAFCFAVAIGALWELFEFSMDSVFGFNLQKTGLGDTMKDMAVNAIGAGLVSIFGYFRIKEGKLDFVSGAVEKVIRKNPDFFKSEAVIDKPEEHIKSLVSKGEGHDMEFKSTLRTNLF
jgi:uncharacterized membrane protein YjdF